jgi:hypothetical protein
MDPFLVPIAAVAVVKVKTDTWCCALLFSLKSSSYSFLDHDLTTFSLEASLCMLSSSSTVLMGPLNHLCALTSHQPPDSKMTPAMMMTE